MHPRIFKEFERKESISDGCSVYDFLGGAIDASYKRGWEKNVLPKGASVKPEYPATSEWTIDWIACLLAARLAGDRFTVIELGAGYGQWMVTSILAYKARHPDRPAHGMALEAEKTHYEWLQQHVQKNLAKHKDTQADLLYAAAGYDGVVHFPELDEPDRNYGAGYVSGDSSPGMRKVECLSMQTIDTHFREDVIDLLHVDIQGAEADLIMSAGFENVLSKCRFVLFGTHRSDALHSQVRKALESSGMRVLIDWPRNQLVRSAFGKINTNDGALFSSNEGVANVALDYV